MNKRLAKVDFQLRKNKDFGKMCSPLGLFVLLCSLAGADNYRTTSCHIPDEHNLFSTTARSSDLHLRYSYFVLGVIILNFSFILSSNYLKEDRHCKETSSSLRLVHRPRRANSCSNEPRCSLHDKQKCIQLSLIPVKKLKAANNNSDRIDPRSR